MIVLCMQKTKGTKFQLWHINKWFHKTIDWFDIQYEYKIGSKNSQPSKFVYIELIYTNSDMGYIVWCVIYTFQ